MHILGCFLGQFLVNDGLFIASKRTADVWYPLTKSRNGVAQIPCISLLSFLPVPRGWSKALKQTVVGRGYIPCRRWMLHSLSLLTLVFYDMQMLYYTVAAFVSALATYQESPLLLSCHMIDVVNHSPLLREVINVITEKSAELFLTLLLGVVVIYLYTVFGFTHLHDEFEVGGHAGCSALYECLLMQLDYGFRDAPSFNAPGAPIRQDVDGFVAIVPFLFDFSYNLLINLILIAIITGIVIDSFSARRESDQLTKDRLANECFICALSRTDFNIHGLNFQKHTGLRTALSLCLYLL
eukprot:SAG11_NODE_479_length_9108_cov_3.699856_7_plen_296_part_00